jgi:hypothetical protein
VLVIQGQPELPQILEPQDPKVIQELVDTLVIPVPQVFQVMLQIQVQLGLGD